MLAVPRPRRRVITVVAAVAVVLAAGPVHARADDVATASPSATASAPAEPSAAESATTAPTPAPTPASTASGTTSSDPTSSDPTSPDPTSPDPTAPVGATTSGDPTTVPGDTVTGELVQAYLDPSPDTLAADRDVDDPLLSWVRTSGGDAVRVPTEDVSDVARGATVEVTVGEPVHDEAVEAGYQPALDVLSADVLAAPVPDQQTTAQTVASVNHQVTVVMMQPAGAARDATTLAQVVSAVNGPVGDFWEQQSGGVVRLGVSATVDWFQGTTTCADPYQLWAEAAARARWTAGPGKHLLVYVPYGTPGCSYGLGLVGQNTSSGGELYVEASATSVIAHELGHNFGLNHSSELQCNATVEGPVGTACQVTSYQDYYDVMGISWSQVGTLSALQQAALGVLPAGQWDQVGPSSPAGDHTLSPLGGGRGTRAIQLTTSAGAVYWLEYRTAVGQDAWLAGAPYGLQSGVLLRRVNPGAADSSLLLDPTPSASGAWSSDMRTVLVPGTTVVLADGAVTVTVTSQTSAAAIVHVVPGRAPVGSLEDVSLTGLSLRMSGWAFDPDVPATSVPVHVYVDGRATALVADRARDDIASAYPGAGPAHGWAFTAALGEGSHSVCAYAIGLGAGPGTTTLGCRSVTAVTRTPVGAWDEASAVGSRLTVRGWALDPDQLGDPVAVHVYVDGQFAAVTADGSRPDVGLAFPGAGSGHGFGYSVDVRSGVHSVCLYAIDVDVTSRNSPLGCRSVSTQLALPVANWDGLSAAGSTVSLWGWAFDPDQLGAQVSVHVYVDGRWSGTATQVVRSDVGQVFPGAGSGHGFAYSASVAPGAHSVCVYAIDVDVTSRNTPLGCRSVTTP